MKNGKKILLGVVLSLLFCAPAFGVVIKIGSIAPENSPWGAALNKLAAEWAKASGGKVELKIYHNGIAGDESDMIRKIKFNQMQGGVFTSFGLNEISPEILTFSIPFVLHDDKELDYLFDKMKPYFEAKIEAKKMKVAAWAKAGWVRFFSRKPVVNPEDLKAQKLAGNPDDQALLQAWKSMGYSQVPVAIPNILTSLNSGMIDAVYSSPLAVGGFQWFGLAKYMADLKIAPFIGAIVISESAWNQVPADLKDSLLAISQKIEKELNDSIITFEADAINTMKKYGLIVTPIPAASLEKWRKEIELGKDKILGKTFSKEVFDIMKKHLEEYRKK